MMKVTLIDYTGNGNPNPDYAIDILLFTKSTRLTMRPQLLEAISGMERTAKIEELNYMARTIPSSWEFVDFTFMIQDVTRAFTHQLVRTRTASFAQQTMRVLDVSDGPGWDYATGPTIEENPDAADLYCETMDTIACHYKALIASGAAIEDARGILPTNILTSICVKMNMRTFCEMVRKRKSVRTQGEYRDVMHAMQGTVLAALPWVRIFLQRSEDGAVDELECEIAALPISHQRTRMVKLIDIIRNKGG
jgi:flavin-dependent thymidylate synthase